MKILFCGTMVPEAIEYQVKDISAAGNRFQNNMIKNLEKAGHKVVSCSFLGMNIPEAVKKELQGNYAFKNGNLLRGIRNFQKLLTGTMSDTETVVCYNIAYAWLNLPLLAKRKKKHSIVIMADYSESVSYKSVFGKLYAGLQLWSMRRFDTVVGLSSRIESKLRKGQQFILMEGGIDGKLYDSFSYRPHEEGAPIVFLYAGLLNHVTGVNLLLKAMEQVKRQDIRLWISGKGEMEEEVKAAAKKDGRICYLGHLPYEEYVKRLQEADVLVNPRDMKLPENQNNFPSKVMDYLAAGKAIISTKFAGWERFEGNIIFCGSTVEDLAAEIEKAEFIECTGSIGDAGKHAFHTEEIYEKNRKKAAGFRWDEQIKRILW